MVIPAAILWNYIFRVKVLALIIGMIYVNVDKSLPVIVSSYVNFGKSLTFIVWGKEILVGWLH